MAAWHERITHIGTCVFAPAAVAGCRFAEMSRARIMPIVFCASFMPWLKLNMEAETSWPLRKKRSTLRGEAFRKR